MAKIKKVKTILDKMDRFAPSMYDADCNRQTHQRIENFGWAIKK